jgi:HSP20 family protein
MLWPRVGYSSGWNPWRELNRLQDEMERLFARGGEAPVFDFPAVNVWSGPDDVVLTAELPGVEPDKLEISVVGDTVTLRGSRQHEELKNGESYHRHEREQLQFSRSLRLPFQIDSNTVDAKFADGVLHLTLPRAESEKPKRITVKGS